VEQAGKPVHSWMHSDKALSEVECVYRICGR